MAAQFLNFTNVAYDDVTSTSKYSIVKNDNVTRNFSIPKKMKQPSYVYPVPETELSCKDTLSELDDFVYSKSEVRDLIQKMKDEVYDVLSEVVNVNKRFIMEEDIDNNVSFKVYAQGISENEVQFRYDSYFQLADKYVKYDDEDKQVIILDSKIFTLFNERTTKTYNLWWEKIDHGMEYHERSKFSINDLYIRYDESGNPIIMTNISNLYNFTTKDGICYNASPKEIPVETLFLQKEYPALPDDNVAKATDGSDVVRIDKHNLYDFTSKDTTAYDIDLIMRLENIAATDNLATRIKEIEGDPTIMGIKMPVATYTGDIEVTKTIEIHGNCSGISASVGSRCQDGILENETVIDGYVNLKEGCEVIFDGITFMNNANFMIDKAKKVTFRNCRFISLYPNNIPEALKSYAIRTSATTAGALLIVENCFFGDTPTVDDKYTDGMFEIRSKLADGSTISNNYFTDAVCKSNIISIYDVNEDANIYIENNLFENSGNAVRVGIVGAPYATLSINNNIYNKSEVLPDYQGLMLIEPYKTETVSMANITIDFSGNKCLIPVSQNYYVYYTSEETQLVKELQPKVYVNGILQ